MADTDLNVKFKLDTSELKSGADDAKNQVKQAAQSMESDVQGASTSMEKSLKDVSNATEGIGEATKTATNAVKQMEVDVVASAKNMEQSLDGVSKKMSTMMIARGASKLAGMAGGIIANYAGDSEAGQLTGHLIQGTARGIRAGAMLGPMGAVGGALLGASAELMKAGKELQDAAKKQDEKAKSDLETQRQEIVHQESVNKWTKEAQTLARNAYGDETVRGTEEGKAALNAEIAAQQSRIDDLTKRRNQIALNYDENGDVFGQAEKMRALNDAIAFATEKLEILTDAADAAAKQNEKLEAAEAAALKATEKALAARQKEAEAARKKAEAEEAAARKKEQKEAERVAKAAHKAEVDQVKEEKRQQERTLSDTQRQLQGVINNPFLGSRPTDSLTRMGGGRGYTDYNNSTAKVQMSIEANLKTLVSNQQRQLQEIINKMENFSTTGTWAE